MMEEHWIIDRGKLRQLMQTYPTWSNRQYAEAVGRCRKWVQKWKKRLKNTDPEDPSVLQSQSRARKTPPQSYHPNVIRRILDLRDHPPAEVPRKLGPKPILYFLHQDVAMRAYRLPRSSSTVWKILDANQRILRPIKTDHQPFERPEPMDTWEIDFTDVSTAQATQNRKQAHQVEAFAVVDRGTSILVDLQASDNYHARTAVSAMASTLIEYGRPQCIVFDRDPRWIGSWSAEDFPSAFMRFLLCLDMRIDVCPPQRPDLKPFVERYFGTLTRECIDVSQPQTATQARERFHDHRYIYNHLRPNQSSVCNNQPPYAAFPSLPSLPHLPQTVDPNLWLMMYHHRQFKRRVNHSGQIQIDKHRYYIKRTYAGRYVLCRLDAHQQAFEVNLGQGQTKAIPIKGLVQGELEFGDYLDLILEEAESEERRLRAS